jgi:hypothetical protein
LIDSKVYNEQVMFEALNDGCVRALNSGPPVNDKPKVCVLVPVLPMEVRGDVLRSIALQSVEPNCIILLTKKVREKLPFPAKMSVVLNEMLGRLKLEYFDYLLRVDADTVLPSNFIEENIKGGFDAVGEGYAQLIRVAAFREYCGGRFHPDHDDGYILVKFAQLGLKVSHTGYIIKPIVERVPGIHQGSSWFVAQGDLKYRYGWEPSALLFNLFMNRCQFSIFELYGYFLALVKHKKRFDVSAAILDKQLMKYRHPTRFARLPKFMVKVIRGIKIE